MLEIGTKAPDFELPDQNGEMHKLSDYLGKKVILYFYPKDNTAGCTKQACGFSERYPQFTEKGAVILGVSKDSVASHKKFEEKYGLAFTLLADPERKVIEAYDVWKEKKNYGKVSMGVVRTTYLIGEDYEELPKSDGAYIGVSEGVQWSVPEVDTKMLAGWFWRDSAGDSTTKSEKDLADIYFRTVGRGATLLMNLSPNKERK